MLFTALVAHIATYPMKHEAIKPAIIAQAIEESGRGSSKLAINHKNFWGMKARAELLENGIGKRVWYFAHDGWDYYMHFDSIEEAFEGYLAFKDRSPYKGWEDHAERPEDYLAHLVRGRWAENPAYLSNTVEALPEARKLLQDAGWQTTTNNPWIMPAIDAEQTAWMKTKNTEAFRQKIAELIKTPYEDETGHEKKKAYLRIIPTKGTAPYALKMQLRAAKTRELIDEILVSSGTATTFVFRAGASSEAGSLEPAPEGYYKISPLVWADEPFDYKASFGAGLGPFWSGMTPQMKTERGNLGIHLDSNIETSEGTAGCIGIATIEEARQFIDWWRDYEFDHLTINYFLGTVETNIKYDDDPEQKPPTEDLGHLSKAKGVLVSVGHGFLPNGKYDPGATAHGIKEHVLNKIAAEACKNYLNANGIPCDITDAAGSLYQTGYRRIGYQVALEVHHNAFNGSVQGTEVLYHTQKAENHDILLATITSKLISSRLGIKNRGAKAMRLGFVSGAEDAEAKNNHYKMVQASILTEGYFMDAVKSGHEKMSRNYGIALAEGIIEWLQKVS